MAESFLRYTCRGMGEGRRTNWAMLGGLAVSAAAHTGIAVATLNLASMWDGGAADSAHEGLALVRDAMAPLPVALEPPPPKPEPPRVVEEPPKQAPAEPELALGRDDSDATTATWIGAAPKDAVEATGRVSTIDQGAYARPAGDPEPQPAIATSAGTPGDAASRPGAERVSIVPAQPRVNPAEPAPELPTPPEASTPPEAKPPEAKPSEATPPETKPVPEAAAQASTEPPVAPPAQQPSPKSPEPTLTPAPATAPQPSHIEGQTPDAKDDTTAPAKTPAELLQQAQKLINEATALIATHDGDAALKPLDGKSDGAVSPKPDAKDDKDQEQQDESPEKVSRTREGLGDAPEDAPKNAAVGAERTEPTPTQQPPADRAADPLNPEAQRERPDAPRDAARLEFSTIEDAPRPRNTALNAPPDPAPNTPSDPSVDAPESPEQVAPMPPTPAGRQASPGQEAIPAGVVPDSTSGEVSDRESIATAIKNAVKVEPGQPVAGKGLTVKTLRPRWSHFTLITAAPDNAVVRVDFGKDGKVANVELLRSSGRTDVDRPMLDAVYMWTASGKQLRDLPDLDANGKPSVVRMTFEMILGR